MPASYADARRFALTLPEVEEVHVENWGHPTLRVRGRMFASGAPDAPTMTLKADRSDQRELVAERPETFAVAAYVGRYGWVQVTLAGIEPAELAELLTEAWRRTAPKRLVAAYDSDSTR
jgi:hypothetical protein